MAAMDSASIAGLVDRKKRLPMYIQLAQSIEALISAGSFLPNEALPTEAELCKLLGISAVTVKKGFGLLVSRKMVRRIPGRGTFVGSRPSERAPERKKAGAPAAEKQMAVVFQDDGTPASASFINRVASSFEITVNRSGGTVRYIAVADAESFFGSPNSFKLDGVALLDMLPDPAAYANLCALVERSCLPTVSVSTCPCQLHCDSICFDQTRAGFLAAQHAVSHGYRRFVLAGSDKSDDIIRQRILGFEIGAKAFGISRRAVRTVELPARGTSHDDVKLVAKIEEHLDSQTMIIALNDDLAAGIAGCLLGRGLKYGSDFALIGCDDLQSLRHMGVTTLAFPCERAGELAAKRLLGQVETSGGTFKYALWPHILRRQSAPGLG